MRRILIALVLILSACASPAGPPRADLPERSEPLLTTGYQPPAALYLCPGMRIGFSPAADTGRRILTYRQSFAVRGVTLLTSPVEQVCLSRAAGRDVHDAHEGLDLAPYPRDQVRMVRAGGAGVVAEVGERQDFGIYVLIDHGNGVYTRYAHLAFASPGIVPGRRVAMGEPIGQMGGTGGVPIHLHYAILTGNYHTPARSFGLTPVNPFDLIARGALGS